MLESLDCQQSGSRPSKFTSHTSAAGKPQIWKFGRLSVSGLAFQFTHGLLLCGLMWEGQEIFLQLISSLLYCICAWRQSGSYLLSMVFNSEAFLLPGIYTGHVPPCLACSGPFILKTISLMRALPSWPNNFLKATCPNNTSISMRLGDGWTLRPYQVAGN